MPLPTTVLDRFTLLPSPRAPASPSTTARDLCRHYHPVSYDTLTHTDAERTAAYMRALATVARGACVLDLGTGAHATLALAALDAGAALVVAFELNERALRSAVHALRTRWAEAATTTGGTARVPRLATVGPVAWRYATAAQEVWVVRGDVTVTCAHADVVDRLERWWATAHAGDGVAPRIVLAHELLDDLASSEDASAIVGTVQRTLCGVVGDARYLPVSVPERARTMACPVHVPPGTDDEGLVGAGAKRSYAAAFAPPPRRPNARLVARGAALYTHAVLPPAWRVAPWQPVETLAFATTLCPLGDITHAPVTFVCDRRPVHALALTLRFDVDATTVYDVSTATRSNWRTVLVAVPAAVNGALDPDDVHHLTVQLTMRRSATAQLSYTLRFRCEGSGAEAATTIAWADVVAAVGWEGVA